MVSIDTVNVDTMFRISGMMVVTVSGDLQLYHGSELTQALGTMVMANSSLILTKTANAADLAEIYGTMDESIGAGDVVSLDPSLNSGVKKSDKAYDPNAFGIISISPSLVMGSIDDPEAMPVMVALSGRVPVKVTTENGPIMPGDLLTSSSTPGVAMRATKAGQIIGQAMTEFDGDGVGSVLVFIKNDYANGAKIADLLPGLSQDGTQLTVNDIGKYALTQFISQKEQLAEAVNLSEIVTDRISAGLEIISPRVIADEVITNSIAPVEKDLTVKLASEGKFIITGEGESTSSAIPVITFDSFGNAFFKGTIIADRIQANQIEGLEFLIASATGSAEVISDTLPVTGNSSMVLGDFTASGSSVFKGIVNVEALTTFFENTVFKSLTEFFGEVIFKSPVTFISDVLFKGRVTFNSDTAGTAVIAKSTMSVDVPFETPYTYPPIVTISLNIKEATDSAFLSEGVHVAVANVSEKGFMIVLNEPVPRDLTYSWIALAVTDARRVVGKSVEESGSTLFISPTPVVLGETTSVTPSLTPTPTMVSIPTPTPTIVPTLTPTPIPTTSPIVPSPIPIGQTVTVLDNELGFVRMRASYTTDSDEVGTIPVGSTIPYLDEQYGWYKVAYDGKTGWISGTYVSKQ
jgi:hypothetical protein